jgi:VWFA-related protein
VAIAFALLLAAGLTVPPEPAAASVPAPVVDVIVTDARGRAVDSLKPGDFSVLVQGAPETVTAAPFVRTRERLFAIFLDEFHTTPDERTVEVREALARFVRDDLQPGDQVVVFKPLDSILTIALSADRAAAVRQIEAFEGRQGDYAARTALERSLMAGSPARIEAARTQIAVSALNALATHLGTLGSDRKTLIVVSDGLGDTPRLRRGDALPTLGSVQRSADRARVSVYAIETRAASPDAPDAAATDALAALAAQTGGRTIGVGDDVESGLHAILADASGYYALTLSPEPQPPAGGFRSVDVRVAKAGASVRARRGYWPVSADELKVRSVGTPARIVPEPPRHTSGLIRPWFGMAKGADGHTRVSFVWEPAPRVPGDRTRVQAPARVDLDIVQPDGTSVFKATVRPATADAGSIGTEPSRAVADLPPGRLRVQMAIEDASSRVLDTDVRDLVVSHFGDPLALGTPEVLRARSAREFRELSADPDATPVAARQFSRAERLLVRVPVYAASRNATVSARLVSRFGSAMGKLAAVPPDSGEYRQFDLPLAGLAAGEYTIELNATDGGREAKDSIPIRVTF